MVNRMNSRRRFFIISSIIILVLLIAASAGLFIERLGTSSIQAFISHSEQLQAPHQVGQNLFVNDVTAWQHLSAQQQTNLVNALHSEESIFEAEYKSKQFTRPLFPQASQESPNRQALFNVIEQSGAMAVHDSSFGFGWGMSSPFTTPPPSTAALDTLTNSFIPCVSEQSSEQSVLEVCGGFIADVNLYTSRNGQYGFSGVMIAAIGYAAAIAQTDLVAALPSSALPLGSQDGTTFSMHTFSVDLASNSGSVDIGTAPASLYEEGPWGQEAPKNDPENLAGVGDSLTINLPGIETIEKAISVAQAGYDALESTIQEIQDPQSVAPCTILTGMAFDQAIYAALAKNPVSIPSASCNDTPVNWSGMIPGDTSPEFDIEPTATAVDFGAGAEFSALYSVTSAQISVSSSSTTPVTTPVPQNLPKVDNALVQEQQTALQLPSGSGIYIFGYGTGGAYPASTFQYGQYASVRNANNNAVASLAITPNNTDAFTTSTTYQVIGGAGVSGYSSYSSFYGSNSAPDASAASCPFQVKAQNSLIVIVAIAGGEQSLQLAGIPGLHIDASYPGSPNEALVIAHTSLPTGSYTVTEQTSQSAAGQTPQNAGDLIGVFVFLPK
jgi:hypothetical protein